MSSEKKRLERARWALRYVMCHPDISPDILSKEWQIPIEDAINICSQNIATAMTDFGIGEGEMSFESLEEKIFNKLVELK